MKKKKLLVSILCAAAVVGLSSTALTSCKKDEGEKPGETETVQVTVSFETGTGASAVAAQKINKGGVATKPADPTKEGYIFGGWYTDSACSDSNQFNFTTTLDADIKLYAKWTAKPTPQPVEKYTVTFDSKGGSAVAAITEVESGAKVTKPTDPTLADHKFEGWYKDEACTQAWDFESDTVTANVTLYAKWTENAKPQPVVKYTVTFDSKGGSAVAAIADVESGTKITKPADPTLADNKFDGWYKDEACTQAWNFESDTVTGNVTLYAKWTPEVVPVEKYTVTFDSKGGSIVAAITEVESGAKITKPTDPTLAEHRFAGWYQDEACTEAWDFENDTVTANTTLYAKWEALSFYQTLVDKGGVVINNDFNSYTATDVLEDYSGTPGTNGLYQHVNVKNGAGDATTNYVALDGDTAHLVDTSEGGTQLIIDFGKELNNGVVEGAFDLTIVNNKGSWTFLQMYGTDAVKANAEVFGFRTEKNADKTISIKYRLDGGSAVDSEIAVPLADKTYNIYFKADMETGKFTVTVDGKAFVTEGTFGITGLSYIKLVSSDGGQATMKIDNLVVRQDELPTAEYIVKMQTKLAAEIEKMNLDVDYITNKQAILDLQASGNAAMAEKQDNAGVYEAYVAVLAQIKAIPTDAQQVLVNAQNEAITTLQAGYDTNKGNYTYTDNSAAYAKALEDGKALIQKATTAEEVATALTDAQALLAAVDTDEVALQKMKTAAIEELTAYKQADDYSKYQAAQYQELLTTHTGNINNATDPEGVTAALTAGKTALDELPNDAQVLATAKENAVAALNTYVTNAITAANLSEADAAQKAVIDAVNAIKEDGITRINEAVSTESVEAIQHEIQNSVDAKIAESTQSVEDYKATAKQTISEHSLKQQEGITDEAVKTAISTIATAGNTHIDNVVVTADPATDKQEITAIMNETIQLINDKVAKYQLGEAKVAAKTSVQEYYNTKEVLQNDTLVAELQTTLNTQLKAIDDATEIAAIDGLVDSAKLAIDTKWSELIETPFTVTYANTTLTNGSVIYGNAMTEPETPTASDALFVNWYADAELTQVYDFTTVLYDNITIYAKWYDMLVEGTLTKSEYIGLAQDPISDGVVTFTGLGSTQNTEFKITYDNQEYTLASGVKTGGSTKNTRNIKIVLPQACSVYVAFRTGSNGKERSIFIDKTIGKTLVTTYGSASNADTSALSELKIDSLAAGTWYLNCTDNVQIFAIIIRGGSQTITVYEGIEGTPTTTLSGVPASKEVLLENLSLTVRDGESIALNTISDKVTITIDNEAGFLAGTAGNYNVTISYGKYTKLSFTVTIA